MATGEDVKRIALTLPGTLSAPHMDRLAFKVKRIYATLAADAGSLNLKLTPEEQEFKVMLAPEAFSPVPGGWGRQGWTTVTLAELSLDELAAALAMAHAHALPARPAR